MLRKLKGIFQKGSFDDKVTMVIIKLEGALNKLVNISESLRKEDRELFENCIEARLKGDSIRAMMYANECAEIRKIALLVVSSKYALEQMVLRLNTVRKLDSILITVSPVVGVINETKSRLVGIVPNVANNLNEANNILTQCLTKMGTSSTIDVQPVVYSQEAVKVLEEAKVAAEKTIRERFPKIPVVLEKKEPEEELITN